jgi:hypothetical protein
MAANTNQIQELNYDEILALIQGQLVEHMNSDGYFEKYNGLKLVIAKEQQYMKIKDKDPNAIYIVVQFGAADVLFGQTVLPVTITALSEQNTLDLTYNLFYEYAQKYNLVRANDNTIQQVYQSPSINGNFNELYEGFRSIVSLSAAFVIGTNSNEYNVYYYYKQDDVEFAEEVPIISTTYAFVGSPDTQAFYNNNNFVKSEIGFGGMTLGFSMFILTDSKIMNDVLDIFGNVKENGDTAYVVKPGVEIDKVDLNDLETIPAESGFNAQAPVNKTFKLGTVYKDGKHARISNYKLTSASSTQEIGQIPVIALAFTE